MDYDLQVTVDGEDLLFGSLMIDETERVVALTSYANKNEWAKACWNEEPAAQKAVYLICKARKGEKLRWADAKFKDGIVCKYVDTSGRQIVVQFETSPDGDVVLDGDGDPKPLLRDGRPVLLYADTGEEVPPTVAEPTASSDTPPTPGGSSESESGIPTTEPS
jgi:hypothetical protein